jgi:hypothetical protein
LNYFVEKNYIFISKGENFGNEDPSGTGEGGDSFIFTFFLLKFR